MLTYERTLSFLKQNPALSLSVLEKEAQLPVSTLSKALTGDRQLNPKHLSSLYPILVKYGFKEFANENPHLTVDILQRVERIETLRKEYEAKPKAPSRLATWLAPLKKIFPKTATATNLCKNYFNK